MSEENLIERIEKAKALVLDCAELAEDAAKKWRYARTQDDCRTFGSWQGRAQAFRFAADELKALREVIDMAENLPVREDA
jgi:hypothetical protein